MGRWDQLDGLVEATYDAFGKVDTLINNAGMSPLYGKLSEVTEKLYDSVFNLNLKGPFRLSALVGERMRRRRRLDHQREFGGIVMSGARTSSPTLRPRSSPTP